MADINNNDQSGFPSCDADFTVTDGKIDAVQVVVDSTEAKVDIIDTNVDTSLISIAAVEAKVDIVTADVGVIDGNVDTLLLNVATVDGKADTIIVDVGVVDGKLDTTLLDIAAAEAKVDTSILDIAAAEAKVDTAISDISGVDTKVDAVISDIGDVQTTSDNIETKVDNIQSDITSGNSEINKIDSAATNGLSGVHNSLAYRVEELEKHFHNMEYWFGAADTPSGETHVADEIGSGIQPFQVTSGNDDWGAWTQIFGTADGGSMLPYGYTKVDMHKILITNASSSDAPYGLQFGKGESGAQVVVTTIVFKPISNRVDSGPVAVMMSRISIPEKGWCRIITIGENAKTLDFYIGIHGYVA